LGLGIPLLLIAHAVKTRLAMNSTATREYHRVVWALWTRGEGASSPWSCRGGCMAACWASLRVLPASPVSALALCAVRGRLASAVHRAGISVDGQGRGEPLFCRSDEAIPAAAPPRADARAPARRGARPTSRRSRWYSQRGGPGTRQRRRKLLVTIEYRSASLRVPRGWTVLEASRSRTSRICRCAAGGRGARHAGCVSSAARRIAPRPKQTRRRRWHALATRRASALHASCGRVAI
jgi:hypothetical protein